MQNVVQLNVPSWQTSVQSRQAVLLQSFAEHRRFGDDVFWLKENAELLNVLESTGASLGLDDLTPLNGFYANIEKRMGFFPQYYRFLLSICLDLEELGFAGGKGEMLSNWVAEQGLADAELSDLQRAEARRLCARRGVEIAGDAGLDDRLRGFARRSETFAMPNKKAAYELTHIVFYLSEYGRVDPGLDDAILESLGFAGTLAFLDQNADLLAEICIALYFAGQRPPSIWESWLIRETRAFAIDAGPEVSVQDDYHEFLMCNWFMSVADLGGFAHRFEPGRLAFRRAKSGAGPLRELSECMFRMDEARSGDWEVMREAVADRLSEEAHQILTAAEAASDRFDAFFAGFARVGLQGIRA